MEAALKSVLTVSRQSRTERSRTHFPFQLLFTGLSKLCGVHSMNAVGGIPCFARLLQRSPANNFALSLRRTKIVINEKALTKRVSRSSGPGGQSVNMSDTRVQMSFKLDKVDWIPEKVRLKMREIHKNRISKAGEFSVACQQTSSQLDNTKIAIKKIGELIAEDFKEHIVERFKREGREKDLEKREQEGRNMVTQAIKETKRRMREKTKNKKISMY
ncbi:unnamed protein product [Cladocopium goreaui]|uniref:Peptidyl-tRNA hydrolase ICT1, mitochondrial n=1 Tax=Cladocopium goreaui TaxID=2562237 RepID=A0A9P1FM89_9DINO|nr:unnamed protein product [Cladocopium goreaui]